MSLEQLRAREAEVKSSIMQVTNQLFVLQGHKDEVNYQIKMALEAAEAEATPPETEAPVDAEVVASEVEPLVV